MCVCFNCQWPCHAQCTTQTAWLTDAEMINEGRLRTVSVQLSRCIPNDLKLWAKDILCYMHTRLFIIFIQRIYAWHIKLMSDRWEMHNEYIANEYPMSMDGNILFFFIFFFLSSLFSLLLFAWSMFFHVQRCKQLLYVCRIRNKLIVFLEEN